MLRVPGNHKGISKALGYKNVLEYRYWKESTRSLDIEGMLEDLKVSSDHRAHSY